MSENHTLSHIHEQLLTERVALCGVSPVVGAQNQEIVDGIRSLVSDVAPEAIGVQLLGSRAQGVSALTSDIDLAIVRFDTSDVFGPLVQAVRKAYYPLWSDASAAVDLHCLATDIPTEPERFAQMVVAHPAGFAALFNAGIYETPSLRLSSWAVLRVMARMSKADREKGWDELVETHNMAYLGGSERVREKLAERLGISYKQTLSTDDIMQRRWNRFGLMDYDDTHEETRLWYETNREHLTGIPGINLITDVKG